MGHCQQRKEAACRRHSSSAVQQAREALAARLRDIRLDSGITKRELAARCGWHEAKSSRIESARTPPSDADIRAWCAACGADDQAPDLTAANRQSTEMHVEWRRLQRSGLRQLQESGATLYERTRQFRVYCFDVVPAFLQTPGYASALLSLIASFRGMPDDVSRAVEARMRSNSVVREGGHRFALVIEESVLRHRISDADTMAGQLGHLLTSLTLPSVALGAIPFAVQRTVWPRSALRPCEPLPGRQLTGRRSPSSECSLRAAVRDSSTGAAGTAGRCSIVW
ncbi:Scr1 family TA system antitoxin-like transcriptional regulator [Streptomyces phaeochromogenes]|uniref:Scr1 family TA system antitoxin-like transcriptional regulator n=1 Tax=Streptomyces phaeochromogenes TaxID=1923 RepID=UPI003674ED53